MMEKNDLQQYQNGTTMNSTMKAGLVLGLLVTVWTFLMGVTGWYRDPVLLNLFWVVIVIQIGVLIWGLKITSNEGKSYWSQVGAGTMMSLVGGVIIFLGSILLTSVVFPNHFAELRALGEEMMRAEGKAATEIKAILDSQAPMQTTFMQALFGFIGTMVTGFVVSLIAGASLKKKDTASTPSAPTAEQP